MNDSAAKAPEVPSVGFLGSVTQLLTTLVEMAYTRLELMFMEFEQGLGGLVVVLLWSFVALFAASAGLFIGALALIFAFWDTHRVLVSLLVMGAFLVLAAAAVVVVRAKLRSRRAFFSSTLAEFAKDRDFLKVQS